MPGNEKCDRVMEPLDEPSGLLRDVSYITLGTCLLHYDKHSVQQFVVLGQMENPDPVVQLTTVPSVVRIAKEIEKGGAVLQGIRAGE